MKTKTWKILSWPDKPVDTSRLMLACPWCGTDAALEVDAELSRRTIAAIGLNLIFDPPSFQPAENSTPDEIKCRTCRRIFK